VSVDRAVVDAAVLDQLLDATGGDEAFVDSLIDTYLADAPNLLDALQAAVASDDPAALVLPAHTFGTTSLTIGAGALGEACRALEADARHGIVTDPGPRVTAIASAFAAVRLAFEARRGGG
jgi:HPt (histidine-containing phosphotransfer) domain-containing protein